MSQISLLVKGKATIAVLLVFAMLVAATTAMATPDWTGEPALIDLADTVACSVACPPVWWDPEVCSMTVSVVHPHYWPCLIDVIVGSGFVPALLW